ncbi:hypothetical protein HDU67_008830, partial [Dinochytrium kinnereticum]
MAMNKKYLSVLVLAMTVVLLVTVVSVVGVFNRKEGQKKKRTEFTSIEPASDFPLAARRPELALALAESGYDEDDYQSNPCMNYTYVMLQASVTNFDLTTGIYKIKLDFHPCGDFIDTTKLVVGKSAVLGTPLKISFDSKIYNFTAGIPMPSQDFSSNFETGDINNYPFDKYTVKELYTEGEFFNRTRNQTELISIALGFSAGLLTYSVQVDTIKDVSGRILNGHVIQLDFHVIRSVTTIFFSGLVMTIMWCLSLLAFTLAVTLWIRGRKVEPPTIAFSIALLFALPGIRNIQPGSPPIGCTADVVSFFWAMVLAAVTASLLMANYILKYNFAADESAPAVLVEKKKKQKQKPSLPME